MRPRHSCLCNESSSTAKGGKAPTPKHPTRQSPLTGSLAKKPNARAWDDLENVVVEVEIIQWPSATQSPRGRVTEILGYEDDFGVDVEMIIRKHHIPHVFPAEVLEEAQEINPSSRKKRSLRAATSATCPSSPLTAKPPATLTTPCSSRALTMAITSFRST